MMYLRESLIQVGLMAVYAVLHTVLAGNTVKQKLFSRVPAAASFYRFFYNVFALVTAYILLVITPKPDLIVYDLKYPFDMLILIPQFAGLAGFLWTLRYFDGAEFLGIKQILRYYKTRVPERSDEHSQLSVQGPYALSRHPLYLFSILILVCRPQMSLFYLLFAAGSVIYFYTGSYYEEKKLHLVFGSQYSEYCKTVPRIFPRLTGLTRLFHSQ